MIFKVCKSFVINLRVTLCEQSQAYLQNGKMFALNVSPPLNVNTQDSHSFFIKKEEVIVDLLLHSDQAMPFVGTGPQLIEEGIMAVTYFLI